MISSSGSAQNLAPVQMLWVRGDLWRLELLGVRSFLAQGHPVHLYSYDPPTNPPPAVRVFAATDIVPENLAPSSLNAPFAKGSLGSFSDYFRYRLLFDRGGWWSDLDVVALKPWRGFADTVAASTDEHNYGRIANGFVMRFPAGDPVLAACLREFEGKNLAELDIGQTGPILLNRILGPAGVATHASPPEVFASVPWNVAVQLARPRWRAAFDEFKNRIRRPHLAARFRRTTVAVHLWNETWRAAGLDKHARHPASSFYERLHRCFPA